MKLQNQTITTIILTGSEMLSFINDNKEKVLGLAPKITLTDIFQDGFCIFLKFDKEAFLRLLKEKEQVSVSVEIKDFRPQKDGGLEIDFIAA